jgi:hypothetical protein
VEAVRVLTQVARNRPCVREEQHAWLGEGGMEAVAALRATRRTRTLGAASSAAECWLRVLEVNTGILDVPGPMAPEMWDVLAEAVAVTRVNPLPPRMQRPWTRPPEWGPRCTGKTAAGTSATVISALERLGWSQGGSWTRWKVMRRALGADDPDSTRHAEPIFVWEVAVPGSVAQPVSLWDKCAWALVALACIAGTRRGSVRGLLLRNVCRTSSPSVIVLKLGSAAAAPLKTQLERIGGQSRTDKSPIAMEHWLVERFVTPWLQWHRRRGSSLSSYVFPSLVRRRQARVMSAVGEAVDGDLWMEPTKQWSDRALLSALDLVLHERRSRTIQGLRSGSNRELHRHRGDVDDVTRRTLQSRSVKALLGSEVAYHDVFLEDFCAATRRLGGLRIGRGAGGLFVVMATSTSCGRVGDWVPCAPSALPADEESEEEEEEGEEGAFVCSNCGDRVGKKDHFFHCDVDDCPWGRCVRCHPGGPGARLLCPQHTALGTAATRRGRRR